MAGLAWGSRLSTSSQVARCDPMLMDGTGTPCYVVLASCHVQKAGSKVRVLVPRYGVELELEVVAQYEELDFACLRHVRGSWCAMHNAIV